jgi:hypothetical protein
LAQNYLLEENRDDVILVVVDKPRVASLPPTLRCLLKTHIYLKWNPDPLKQPLFWDKLRTALCRSKEGRPSYLEKSVI